jgi:prepilin-type N-terminal cleavage/methylation domain-containing protein
MNASLALAFCHPELVEGSVPFAFFSEAKLILRQAQDDGGLNKKIVIRSSLAAGFTLLEMMITLAIFILLAGAVFGILTGVLQSTSTLQDNQNHKDQTAALNGFLKRKLVEMPVSSTLVSYQRGDGEGLVQNGVIFGTGNLATAIDAKVQANGYYTLRVTTCATGAVQGQPTQDARQVLQQAVTTDDPTLAWTPLITDVKTLDWKFLDFNQTLWVDLWSSAAKPNLVEFSLQPAGELQPVTMDFWLPKIDTITLNAAAQGGGLTQPGGGRSGGGATQPGGGILHRNP